MPSSVFPVSQAPFSSAGNKLHVQIPMNSMSNGFEESFRLEKPLRPLGPAIAGYLLRKLLKWGRSVALHLRNNKALGTVSEGAGAEKPTACHALVRCLVVSQHVGGVGRAHPSRRQAAGWTSGHRMP